MGAILASRPTYFDIRNVCSSCFGDSDLRNWIRSFEGPRGCDACGGYDSPTLELSVICRHIHACLEKFWGAAVDQLPYESAEGGWQGRTWTSYEVLFEEECLQLPRDTGDLQEAIGFQLMDDCWCDYDWLTLDEDVALSTSWEAFCNVVKYQRRFFFREHAGARADDRDSYSPARLLDVLAHMSNSLGLIKELPAGARLWRAREMARGSRVRASDFGPPPQSRALQSNRMNPPGIPMMYVSSTAVTAAHEIRAERSRVGLWRSLLPIKILDLRRVLEIPGTFSDADRNTTLALRFLHKFTRQIVAPIARDEGVHIDYLPSQVVSEFFRDYRFDGCALDGIAYPSSVHATGWNVALFFDEHDLVDDSAGRTTPQRLRYVKAKRIAIQPTTLNPGMIDFQND